MIFLDRQSIENNISINGLSSQTVDSLEILGGCSSLGKTTLLTFKINYIKV